MSAGKLDLDIEQGVTWRLGPMLWRQPSPDDGVTPGEPYDLTGVSAKMEIRTIVGGRLLVSISDSGGIILGGAAGTLALELTAAQTGEIFCDHCVYDLVLTFPSGDVVRLLEGIVNCDLAVTTP